MSTPQFDEHGNILGVMYRIPFPKVTDQSYFYTELAYRELQKAITTTQSQLKETLEKGERGREMANRLASELKMYAVRGQDDSAVESMTAHAALAEKEGA